MNALSALSLLALAASASGWALPNLGLTSRGEFAIRQHHNKDHRGNHGASALAHVYHKYHKPMPGYLDSAVQSHKHGSTGSAPNAPEAADSEYVLPVSIGTPPQQMNLDLDTGSSDLWVFSSETPISEVAGQVLYDITKSTSAKKLTGYSWGITYGDGSTSSGDVYSDVVSIGGVTFNTQAVESAANVSSSFTSDASSSGILGMGFPQLNTIKPTAQNTFFDNVRPSLKQPYFAADLRHGAPGTYTFGYYDTTVATSAVSWTTVDNSGGYWSFTSSGYAIGSGALQSVPLPGVADTGTTLLLLPDSVVQAYWASVPGSSLSSTYGGYVFPCTATLPSFTYVIGTQGITIPGTYLNYAGNGDGSCYGSLQSNDGVGFSIFGDIALKSALVIFEIPASGPPQLGFATKALQ